MVFQHYALFPHLDVAANVSYGLRQMRPRPLEREIVRRVGRSARTGAPRRLRQTPDPWNSPAASSSASRWPAPSSTGRRCCCSTSRWRRSTASCDRDADRAADPAARARHHLPARHPRPGGGAVDERLRLRHECRPRSSRSGTPREVYDAPVDLFVADFVGKTNLLPGRSSERRAALLRLARQTWRRACRSAAAAAGQRRGGRCARRPSGFIAGHCAGRRLRAEP